MEIIDNKTSKQKLMTHHFKKEGELSFIDSLSNKIIIIIDIEVANDDNKKKQGLMYRHSIKERQGMLFIFEKAKPLSMWMKNTFIPLDIIFVNENYAIETIQENAEPLSKNPILSHKNVLYVVEVVAGFCDKYKVKEGDTINFKSI